MPSERLDALQVLTENEVLRSAAHDNRQRAEALKAELDRLQEITDQQIRAATQTIERSRHSVRQTERDAKDAQEAIKQAKEKLRRV